MRLFRISIEFGQQQQNTMLWPQKLSERTRWGSLHYNLYSRHYHHHHHHSPKSHWTNGGGLDIDTLWLPQVPAPNEQLRKAAAEVTNKSDCRISKQRQLHVYRQVHGTAANEGFALLLVWGWSSVETNVQPNSQRTTPTVAFRGIQVSTLQAASEGRKTCRLNQCRRTACTAERIGLQEGKTYRCRNKDGSYFVGGRWKQELE